jgi:hypothetical protein
MTDAYCDSCDTKFANLPLSESDCRLCGAILRLI